MMKGKENDDATEIKDGTNGSSQVYIPRQYEQHIPESGSQSRGWRLFASLQVAE